MRSTIWAISLFGKALEHDNLVEAVQELGPEELLHLAHHAALDFLIGKALLRIGREAKRRGFGDLASAHVRGHDDNRVAEVDRAALRIGQGGLPRESAARC